MAPLKRNTVGNLALPKLKQTNSSSRNLLNISTPMRMAQTARLNMSFQPHNYARNAKNASFAGGGSSGLLESSSMGGYAFGSTLKPSRPDTAKLTPGPGSYNTSSKLLQKSSSAAGIGIGKRMLHQQRKETQAGPGDYKTSSTLVQKKGSAAGIGMGTRFEKY